MKKLLTLLAISILAFAASRADAATKPAGLNFTRPATWSDGSTLLPSEILGYQVGCQFTATGASAAVPCTLTGSPLAGGSSVSGSVTVTYPPIGGEACFTLRTVAVGNILALAPSDPPTCRTMPALTPGNPTNVTVTISVTLTIQSDSPISVAMSAPVVTGPAP